MDLQSGLWAVVEVIGKGLTTAFLSPQLHICEIIIITIKRKTKIIPMHDRHLRTNTIVVRILRETHDVLWAITETQQHTPQSVRPSVHVHIRMRTERLSVHSLPHQARPYKIIAQERDDERKKRLSTAKTDPLTSARTITFTTRRRCSGRGSRRHHYSHFYVVSCRFPLFCT